MSCPLPPPPPLQGKHKASGHARQFLEDLEITVVPFTLESVMIDDQ